MIFYCSLQKYKWPNWLFLIAPKLCKKCCSRIPQYSSCFSKCSSRMDLLQLFVICGAPFVRRMCLYVHIHLSEALLWNKIRCTFCKLGFQRKPVIVMLKSAVKQASGRLFWFPLSSWSFIWPIDTILCVCVAYIKRQFRIAIQVSVIKVKVAVAKIENEFSLKTVSLFWPIDTKLRTLSMWVAFITTLDRLFSSTQYL